MHTTSLEVSRSGSAPRAVRTWGNRREAQAGAREGAGPDFLLVGRRSLMIGSGFLVCV